MSQISPMSAQSAFSDANAGLLQPPVADAARTRLDDLLALAGNLNATPVARGEALAEAEAIMGDRTETMLAQAGAGTRVGSAPALVASAAQLDTRVGTDVWTQRTQGLELQLDREAQLNAGSDPTYARQLAQLADNLEYRATRLPQGTYRSATPPEIVGTQRTNPLALDQISPANSQRTIEGLNTRIDRNNNEIGNLRQTNADLGRRLQGNFNPVQQVDFRAQMTANTVSIQALRAENTFLTNVELRKALNDARLQPGRLENGNMYRAVANGADASRPPVIFINGVNTDVNRSAVQAMELSTLFRAPVDHIVNVSSMDKMVRIGGQVVGERFTNLQADQNVLDQRLQQLMSGNPPAAATAANAILDQLQNTTGPVKVIGYSQGAAIGNEALRMVNDILRQQGVGEADRARMMDRVEFLGIGPAAGERHIARTYTATPDGPRLRDIPELRAVNYRTISDINDPIAILLNVSNPDGSRANSANLGRSAQGLNQFVSPGGILPHLSYFSTYPATDPGSVYNPEMSRLLNQWYAGIDGPVNTIIRGAGTAAQ